MPTPFMHLQIAETIRTQVRVAADDQMSAILDRQLPAFYLGSVAADYQTIANVPRSETHFYDLPPTPEDRAYPLMLENYPELANGTALPIDQAVFVAAYSAHLLLDLLWFRQILVPYFVEAPEWGNRAERYLAHNLLLAYLDRLAFDSLPAAAAETLSAALPKQWLPFADDEDLTRWRDVLVTQLQPGATLETVKIYARRLKMSPEEFADKLQDEMWIEDQVFTHVPLQEVQSILEHAVPDCIELISGYLAIGKKQRMPPGDMSLR